MNKEGLRQHDVVEGTFQPKRTDDLKPGAVALIGASGKWQALWIIEDGTYKGQWAMAPYEWEVMPPFCWTPECDVKISTNRGDEIMLESAKRFIARHRGLLEKLND
jgi:hypothetical protein